MPSYDGRDEHERLYRDKQAARVEESCVKDWIEDWWAIHQRNDEIRKRIKEASQTHILSAMIERADDIEATVLGLEAMVPADCETFRPARPTTSDVLTCYFGDVRVVTASDVIKGRIVRRADLYHRKAQIMRPVTLRKLRWQPSRK